MIPQLDPVPETMRAEPNPVEIIAGVFAPDRDDARSGAGMQLAATMQAARVVNALAAAGLVIVPREVADAGEAFVPLWREIGANMPAKEFAAQWELYEPDRYAGLTSTQKIDAIEGDRHFNRAAAEAAFGDEFGGIPFDRDADHG